MKCILLYFIRFYRYFIDPLLGVNCRFFPTCTLYAEYVLMKYGLFYSIYLILKRIIKCNQFFLGGSDPVP